MEISHQHQYDPHFTTCSYDNIAKFYFTDVCRTGDLFGNNNNNNDFVNVLLAGSFDEEINSAIFGGRLIALMEAPDPLQ